MIINTLLAWTLLAPAALAISIDSHLSTETAIHCSTIYGKTRLSSIPTTTTLSPSTIELSPVILHNSTTLTKTVTPKPFNTLFSILTTKTKWATSTPVNGTFHTTKTKFGTSTVWHHTTTTKTETEFRYLTSRTTEWIAAPTGFMPVRNTTSAPVEEGKDEQKRELSHPHAARATSKKPKPKVVRPTSGRFAVEVGCKQEVRVHTTEVLMLTETKRATVTLRPETVFKNRTVYGTITSTVLILSSPSSSSSSSPSSLLARKQSTADSAVETEVKSIAAESAARTGVESMAAASSSSSSAAAATSPISDSASSTLESAASSAAASSISHPPPLPTGRNGIVTYLVHTTKTPYTITFTFTATSTSTTTLTRHATTTLTSHAACATSANSLSQTSQNRRINGVSLLEASNLEMAQTVDAGGCCEICMQRKGCAWGVWEAVGGKVGACYLVLREEREGGGKEGGFCERQEAMGSYGFGGGNGEVRYVVSNGICGMLVEA